MEIRVNCNKKIELNNFNKLKIIKINILSYNLNNDTLNGDVKVTGEYLKNDNDELMWFEDLIPFTIVFNQENVNVDTIYIENDNYKIIDHCGVYLNFDIVVKYSVIEQLNNKDEVVEVPVETEQLQQVSNSTFNKENLITAKYESILDNILDVRENNENKPEYIIKNQSTNYKTITVYYLHDEKELEIISKERRIPIQDLYKKNEDFNKSHRIILNE